MLTGSSVRLRTVQEEDLDWLVSASGNPSAFGEFEPFLLGQAESLRWRWTEERLLSAERTVLVIEDRSGRRLGVASVDSLDAHARIARISATILEPRERGKGYGTDAHRVLVEYLFHHWGIFRIEAWVAVGNRAARGVLRRIGFTEEGTLRSRLWAHGQRHDVVVYGLLSEEWAVRARPDVVTI